MILTKILKWPFRKIKRYIYNIIADMINEQNAYLKSKIKTLIEQVEENILYPKLERLKIHKEDFIFWFVYNHPQFNSEKERFDYYFSDGKNSADKIKNLCKNEMKMESRVKLFEFASGYGCVTRHLDLDYFDVTSCDIHPQAMDFLSREFNVKTFLSVSNPDKFKPNEYYNVVFALSFFSHMNNVSFGPWIKALYDCVQPGGYLVFTTHGKKSNELLLKMKLDDGFAFKVGAEQKDIPGEEYGTTISEYCYVKKICEQYIGRIPDIFYEAYWWNHQDLYIIKKLH